jgi:predicted nucleotidyltransferase
MSDINDIVHRCKIALAQYYGDNFNGLIFYGSAARGQAQAASDIDLLVLFNQSFDYIAELYQLIEVLYPVQMESTWLISAKPVMADDFEHGKIQLYRNAKREGIRL